MNKEELELFARCASGFESICAQELRELHLRRVRPLKGGVAFFGSLEDSYRACLWSRVATRIQLVLARVEASDADALYEGVRTMAWEQIVRRGSTIAVDAHGQNDALRNTKFTALKVKDALCDRLRETWGMRPSVDAKNPDFEVNVALHAHKATVYLNMSGPSLHRRAYREDGVQTEAPLKETLAAGMLLAAGWPDVAHAGGSLADPMCGSGTLAIEGALIATNRAPGLLRERWGFEGWTGHDPETWGIVLTKAYEAVDDTSSVLVVAGDISADAIRIAKGNAKRAGVSHVVRFHVDDAARLGRHLRGMYRGSKALGIMAANPPYGKRIGSEEGLPQVNEALAQAVSSLPDGWRLVVITPDAGVDTAFGRTPQRVIDCFNGPLAASVRTYVLDEASKNTCEVVSLGGRQLKIPVAEKNSAQFAARLRKTARDRMRVGRRQGTTCMRVYDADLPDYALSVDVFVGIGASEGMRAALVQEHRRPSSVDVHRAARRLADACALVSAVLDVPRADVMCVSWGDELSSQRSLVVRENGLEFSTVVGGRYERGLVLSLRGVREFVRDHAKNKTFANLFDASSTATAYAAAGGASCTVTLNSFAEDAELARRAMEANGFAGRSHRFVREDARVWLDRETAAHHAYDLVLCVAPAWMGALGSHRKDWELVRDGMGLILQATRALRPGGELVFVCDSHEFKLDEAQLGKRGLVCHNISGEVLPSEFRSLGKTLHCWLICA